MEASTNNAVVAYVAILSKNGIIIIIISKDTAESSGNSMFKVNKDGGHDNELATRGGGWCGRGISPLVHGS